MILITALDLLLEFLHVDLYVLFDLLRLGLEHVPQLGRLVAQAQDRQRVV